jgi:hypothetical protein
VPQSAPLNRAFLIVIALLGWLGIVLQLWVSARLAMHHGDSPWHGIVQALCYFTVLTNILVTLIATRLAWSGPGGLLGRPGTLAAAAVYIVVVGLIYALLLSSLWAPTGLHKLADAILHSLIPVLFLLWWLLYAPKQGLRWSEPVRWLGYPLVYFGFSVVLGTLTGRYLYPFADLGSLEPCAYCAMLPCCCCCSGPGNGHGNACAALPHPREPLATSPGTRVASAAMTR